jgi:hypothetical protein
VFAVGDTEAVPLVFLVPLHPPEATHDVALVEDHVSTEELPLIIVGKDADNKIVGCGGGTTGVTATLTDCSTLPPGPLQLSV